MCVSLEPATPYASQHEKRRRLAAYMATRQTKTARPSTASPEMCESLCSFPAIFLAFVHSGCFAIWPQPNAAPKSNKVALAKPA